MSLSYSKQSCINSRLLFFTNVKQSMFHLDLRARALCYDHSQSVFWLTHWLMLNLGNCRHSVPGPMDFHLDRVHTWGQKILEYGSFNGSRLIEVYSDVKNLLKPLLIVLKICIVELHHAPDWSFGRLEECTCRWFRHINGFSVVFVADHDPQVSNNAIFDIRLWNRQ